MGKTEESAEKRAASESVMDQKTEKLLASMAAAMINPVMILAENRDILYVNDIMEATFGNLVGRNADILFPEGDGYGEPAGEGPGGGATGAGTAVGDDAGAHAYDRAVSDARSGDGVAEIKIADVDYRLIETEISSGADRYLAVMLEDISEKKNIENKANAHMLRYGRDVDMAGHIQKSILPQNADYWDLIRLHSLYLPAENLSGDAYDVIRLSEDEVLIYIADVSGHGIQASLLTMFISEKVRASAEFAAGGLDALLAEILRGYKALGIDARIYLTMLCCKYNRTKRELAIANAGHNCYPLVLRKSGRTEEAPVRGMPISAISEEDSYEEEIIGIAPGDRLLLYTDGIVEEYSKTAKSTFGAEGVRRVAEENAGLEGGELARKIIDEAAKYAMVSASDDRTLLVAEML